MNKNIFGQCLSFMLYLSLGVIVCECESHSVVSDSLQPHGLHSPWNSLGQNTRVGSLSLLQRTFPTQESNPDPPHCGQCLHQLNHKGSPIILEWVAYPFSRSSQPRNLNWGLLHCRWILYHLSYQGSPYEMIDIHKSCSHHFKIYIN